MDISSPAPTGAIKPPEIVPAVAPVVPASAPADDPSATLEPAAQLDLSPWARAAATGGASGDRAATDDRGAPDDRAHYTRDADTQALVYQVVDQGSGEVVVQLPDEHALRARAYARELAARSSPPAPSSGAATDRVA